MTLCIDGKTFKEFRAVCPLTRRQHARVFSNATAHIAWVFLREAVERLGIRAVQVDGGSEFMAECKALGLPLLVLPPRSPQLNGIVERTNRTARVECWSQHRGEPACAAMNEALRRHLHYYNGRWPHRSLGHENPRRVRQDDRRGRLTSIVQKVTDPPQRCAASSSCTSRKNSHTKVPKKRTAGWARIPSGVWQSRHPARATCTASAAGTEDREQAFQGIQPRCGGFVGDLQVFPQCVDGKRHSHKVWQAQHHFLQPAKVLDAGERPHLLFQQTGSVCPRPTSRFGFCTAQERLREAAQPQQRRQAFGVHCRAAR